MRKNSKHESSSKEEEKSPTSSSSTTEENSKARTDRYQIDPSESSPRLMDLRGKVSFLVVGDTITLEGVDLAIQEASPEKCRLYRVTLEDRDQKFAEVKQQLQEEIDKGQEDIRALKEKFTEISHRMDEEINKEEIDQEGIDHLTTQLGIQ